MAQAQTTQKPKTDEKTAAKPRVPKTDAELRQSFGKTSNRILKALARQANAAERIMRKNKASEAQLEAFRKAAEMHTSRIQRAVRGELSTAADVVPLE